MRFIISPAKKMKTDTDTLAPAGLPACLDRAQELLDWMRKKSLPEMKAVWKCSEKIAQEAYARLEKTELKRNLTPAFLSYEGIQYQYMAPAVFEDGQWDYVQEHVRILSGFYGILRPLDGVTPYRLEMQAKASEAGSLYAFWGRSLYEHLVAETDCIVNLASREYALCVEKYLEKNMRYVTCVFGEEQGGTDAGNQAGGKVCNKTSVKGGGNGGRAYGKACGRACGKAFGPEEAERASLPVIQKGTHAKMARGEMVRFAAEHRIVTPEGLKDFNRLGYEYREEYSEKDLYVFCKRVSADRD